MSFKTFEYKISELQEGALVIGNTGKILSANCTAVKELGLRKEKILGKEYRFVVARILTSSNLIEEVLQERTSYVNELIVLKCADGTEKRVLSSMAYIDGVHYGIPAVLILFRELKDIVSLLKEEEEIKRLLEERRGQIQKIFNTTSEGVMILDRNGCFTSFSPTAEEITRYRREDVIGKHFREVMGFRGSRVISKIQHSLKMFKHCFVSEVVICDKKGDELMIDLHSAPLLDDDENHIGSIHTFSEIKNIPVNTVGSSHYDGIIGRSRSMHKIFSMIEKVVHTGSTVLITGDSGTGKEVIARAIHLRSNADHGQFIPVNCSAFTETLLSSELFGHEKGSFTGATSRKLGWFELAKNGTIFLDEIGDISPSVQLKLLRVLDRKEFERVGGSESIPMKARIITATNKNLWDEIEKGNFREDLFYRINVFNIHIPPLRERMEDLEPLVKFYLDKFSSQFGKNVEGINSKAFNILYEYNWPGNIRELINVLEHAFVLCEGNVIDSGNLPEWLLSKHSATGRFNMIPVQSKMMLSTESSLEEIEEMAIKKTLRKYNGHRGKTADVLGIDKVTLWRKIKKYEISL